MKKTSPEVGRRVAELFKNRERGFRAQVARKVGVLDSAVSKWVDGRPPGIETLPRLADALGVTVAFLLTGQEAGDSRVAARAARAEAENAALKAEVRQLRTELDRLDAAFAQARGATRASGSSQRRPR